MVSNLLEDILIDQKALQYDLIEFWILLRVRPFGSLATYHPCIAIIGFIMLPVLPDCWARLLESRAEVTLQI